ncbi:MAG: cytochrome c [Candidatus Dechloromonas phosphoritropha]|jgi:mono/diheme cytochrome c family protein|nr:cytochrome c [Candidatus Dechloromonas phosphoritropha]MBP8785882.1 cytochrome c [Azonexus sp.]MBP9226714.1 cytochrome c [Azonexus sp.]
MKRASLAAIAAIAIAAGIGVYQIDTRPLGEVHAQNTTIAAAASPPGKPIPEPSAVDQDAPYHEACAREGLNESECVGRLIWFKATGGNERFHTYTFQQRIGVLVDWYRVLRTDQRDDRFWAWGIINDPSCCKPGAPDCPAKTAEETYGLDWCPGDDVLLKYVGKSGYVDPACGLKDAALDADDPHSQGGKVDQRHSACDLRFGTSTGALGLRKFPNPRFDAAKWQALNGGNANWSGFNAAKAAATGIESDQRVSKLADASVEPPFLIGTACGSCHIAFDPLNPPADPAHPQWQNIKGLIGNQYTRMSELLVSGMPRSSLEFQIFAHARPGVTDTSAISHDQINNPGTINALINVAQRPVFKGDVVTKWRKATTCGAEKDEDKCWCEPGRSGKCWLKSTHDDDTTPVNLGGQKVVLPGVHHILKGGEDSIGALEAIQRVYFNIGSCSEQCWVNHLTDLRQIDPEQRGFDQTPFNIGQCRRDCPNFRAVEDRLQNVLDFFVSAESDESDLYAARAKAGKPSYSRADLAIDLDKEFGKGAVSRGQTVFADNCARCHSSLPESANGPFKNRDFAAPNEAHPRKVRADFLGNDQSTPVTEVGTFRCRSLHSNHKAGHLYMEYFSDTMRQRPIVADIPERDELKDGGRGYMRNISLVNVWATAPFMHNNAIGPEICGKPANKDNDFSRVRYVGSDGKLLASQPDCLRYDPTVDGRFQLYKLSMFELLHPKERGSKRTLTNSDLIIDVGIRPLDGKAEKPLGGFGQVRIPEGASVGFLNGLQHKQLIGDLFLAKRDPVKLEAAGKKDLVPTLQAMADEVLKHPARFVEILREQRDFLSANYETCTQEIENEGHRFGEDLSEADKKALTAFLATL